MTITLPEPLEQSVRAAADRAGLTLDAYLAAVCEDALTLEIDRARLTAWRDGQPGVAHERAREWLATLAAGGSAPAPR